jgi:hypothetical protein
VIVTTITSSAPYSAAAASIPARTASGVPRIVRRRPLSPSGEGALAALAAVVPTRAVGRAGGRATAKPSAA